MGRLLGSEIPMKCFSHSFMGIGAGLVGFIPVNSSHGFDLCSFNSAMKHYLFISYSFLLAYLLVFPSF